MHRQIINTPGNLVTDHINGNRLDNRRSNLRVATRTENNRNVEGKKGSSSEYKGVGWDPTKNLWQARLRNKHLGYFDDPKEAAHVYDYHALKEYKEFAYLNFPNELLKEYEKPQLSRRNSSGYLGVSWSKDKQKWHAYIKGLDGKRINIGRFKCKHEAARNYNRVAQQLYGENAQLNDIKEAC
jgi:hypothetical protein